MGGLLMTHLPLYTVSLVIYLVGLLVSWNGENRDPTTTPYLPFLTTSRHSSWSWSGGGWKDSYYPPTHHLSPTTPP